MCLTMHQHGKVTYLLLDHVCQLEGASATVRSVGRGHMNILHDHYHILIPTYVIVPVAKNKRCDKQVQYSTVFIITSPVTIYVFVVMR